MLQVSVQKILINVTILKTGRGENSWWVSLLHAGGMKLRQSHKPKSYQVEDGGFW